MGVGVGGGCGGGGVGMGWELTHLFPVQNVGNTVNNEKYLIQQIIWISMEVCLIPPMWFLLLSQQW